MGCVLLAALACRTASSPPPLERRQLETARKELARPLPGNLAALYRLRVPSSGGLRLSVLVVGDQGRVTISEPFGSAVSLTSWSGSSTPEVYDLKEGCRFTTHDLSGVLGVGNLPLPQAVRLLGGRLPAVEGDTVEPADDGRLWVVAPRWTGKVTVASDPWRVVRVEDTTDGDPAWSAQLRDHTSTVPGWIRVKGVDGRWAELELVRLEWTTATELPPAPELPPCGTSGGAARLSDRTGDRGR